LISRLICKIFLYSFIYSVKFYIILYFTYTQDRIYTLAISIFQGNLKKAFSDARDYPS